MHVSGADGEVYLFYRDSISVGRSSLTSVVSATSAVCRQYTFDLLGRQQKHQTSLSQLLFQSFKVKFLLALELLSS